MGVHSGARRFKCDKCTRTYKWKCALRLHMRRVHNQGFTKRGRPQNPTAEEFRNSDEHGNGIRPFPSISHNRTQSLAESDLAEDKPVAVFRIKFEELED